jgi:serine/threonine protein kinase
MAEAARPRGFLLSLAAEGIAPVMGGCAGALAAGPEAGVAGVVVGQVVERAINFFGPRIVQRWLTWLRGRPREDQLAAIAQLAGLPADEARREAVEAVERLAPEADRADKELAVEYLTAIPGAVQRSLVRDRATGALTLPAAMAPDNSGSLLQLLPADVPPYPPGAALPDTSYRLDELLGTGGFGAVYKATDPSLQYLTFAIKFCLDPSMTATLHQERNNLDRLMSAGEGDWSDSIVRLYGYNLDHATPFLVYEYVPGGNLSALLASRCEVGQPPSPREVLLWIVQIVEALAFAHSRGLVHRDLKPANVLLAADDSLKLADFGIGSALATHAAREGRLGSSALPHLTMLEQASLFRGAGTPLYMSQEQKRNEPPDPRHDLYSLGVLWYQLLVGDVTRELHPNWAKELAVKYTVPPEHIAVLERCVGWFEERARDAGELLEMLRPLAPSAPASAEKPATPASGLDERFRSAILSAQLTTLQQCHQKIVMETIQPGSAFVGFLVGSLGGIAAGIGLAAFLYYSFTKDHLLDVVIPEPVDYLLAVLFGILVFAVCLTLGIRAGLKSMERAHQDITQRIAVLAEAFPAAVQAWGGPAVLHDLNTVSEILRVLKENSD